jgi:hypothetical protein
MQTTVWDREVVSPGVKTKLTSRLGLVWIGPERENSSSRVSFPEI